MSSSRGPADRRASGETLARERVDELPQSLTSRLGGRNSSRRVSYVPNRFETEWCGPLRSGETHVGPVERFAGGRVDRHSASLYRGTADRSERSSRYDRRPSVSRRASSARHASRLRSSNCSGRNDTLLDEFLPPACW